MVVLLELLESNGLVSLEEALNYEVDFFLRFYAVLVVSFAKLIRKWYSLPWCPALLLSLTRYQRNIREYDSDVLRRDFSVFIEVIATSFFYNRRMYSSKTRLKCESTSLQ